MLLSLLQPVKVANYRPTAEHPPNQPVELPTRTISTTPSISSPYTNDIYDNDRISRTLSSLDEQHTKLSFKHFYFSGRPAYLLFGCSHFDTQAGTDKWAGRYFQATAITGIGGRGSFTILMSTRGPFVSKFMAR